MQNIRISIPTQAYIVQFTRQLYGHPIPLLNISKHKCTVKQLLFLELSSQTHKKLHLEAAHKNFNSSIHIIIPKYSRQKKQINLHVEIHTINNINHHLQQIFTTTLLQYYHTHHIILGIGFKKSVELFQEQFNITDDMISSEALKKIIQRKYKAVPR